MPAKMIPLEAWIKLLDKFLADAEKSVETGTSADRQAARTRILGFIRSTPAQYEFLDDIAREAIQNLNNASLDIARTNIRNAANALEKQRLIIQLATEEAKRDASEIKMEQLTGKIDEATTALESLKDINKILDDDKDFAKKIKEIQAKLKELKSNPRGDKK